MREPAKDAARLHHIIEAIDYVLEFSKGIDYEMFHSEPMRRFAIIKNIEIIGEAAYMLSLDFKESHSQVNWRPIVGMRHVLVHGYCQINDEMVWATIEDDIIPLRDKIEDLLEELEG